MSLGDLVSEGSLLMALQVTRSESALSRSQNLTRIQDAAPVKLTTEHALSRDEHSRQAKLPADSTEGNHTAIDGVAANNSSTAGSAGVVSANKQTSATPSGTIQPGQPQGPHRYHATPAIRRFARTLGVSLSNVVGSGLKGRIQRRDIEHYIRGQLAGVRGAAELTKGYTGIPITPVVGFAKFGPIENRPLSRIQRISRPFLQRAWLNIPHVTDQNEADITELEAFRKDSNQEVPSEAVRLTPLPFFIKAVCAALKEYPVFSSSLSADGLELIYKHYCNIGVAVDTPSGLVVPVLRDADKKSLTELAQELADISGRARADKLVVHEMQGGCMSISSLGGIGGTGFTPIVNAPDVAILGIARSRMTPVWSGAEFVPRLMLPLCLSFDHRVIDGAQAAHFMRYLCRQLSDVRRLLL